jgi:proteasome lid subunit RPN8/RPN11
MFYEVKGTFNEPDKCQITCKELYTMNIGSSAYTEFDYDTSVVTYMMENKELLSLHQGLIHSHHNMDAYFSSTDMEELDENSENHNMYLSVIVNNAGKIVAKVATRAEYTTKEISSATYTGFDGNEQAVEFKEEEATETVLLVRDCEHKLKQPEIKVDDDFVQRLEDLEETKKKEEEKAKKKKIGYQQKFDWEGVDLGYKTTNYRKLTKIENLSVYNFLKTWSSQNPGESNPFVAVAKKVEAELAKMDEAELELYTEIAKNTITDYHMNALDQDVSLVDGDYIEFIEMAIELLQDTEDCPIMVDTLTEVLQTELDTIYMEMDEFNYLNYLG